MAPEVVLAGVRRDAPAPLRDDYVVVDADRTDLVQYAALRREAFVADQALFAGSDRDDADDDPRTRVLVARSRTGDVVGGVRLHPSAGARAAGRDLGWWQGSRLVVARDARGGTGVAAALVRAACATAESVGALRFDADVQERFESLFLRLGWQRAGLTEVGGVPHVAMRWPVSRVRRLAEATKAPLGQLLDGLLPGSGWTGDDGVPVPGSDLVAACDAIVPSMVEREPDWAGWCSVLVNVNDLCAMGAQPVGLLDAVAGRDASFVGRVLRGLREAAEAWGVPVLGGHTQLGVPAALSVTALGRTTGRPVPGGGASPGERLRLTADLGGGWRPGYTGAQWDSSSTRTTAELRSLAGVVPTLDPTAAKDVSMSGLVGSTGMLAEASGVRAVLDVAEVPVPTGASVGDWFTCFPGFAMVTTEQAPRPVRPDLPGFLETAVVGGLEEGHGVALRWPDGELTEAVGSVTGLGAA